MNSRIFMIGIGGLAKKRPVSPVVIHFLNLGKELTKRGHRVVFMTWPKSSQKVRDFPDVFAFPSPRPTRIKDLWFALKRIKEEKPDAILANFGSVNVLMLAGYLAKVPIRIAWYHTLNEAIQLDAKRPPWQISLLNFRKMLIYRLCTHLVPVSSAGALDLTTIYHIPSSRIHILHNSMPDPLKQFKFSFVRDTNTIVCVGRLDICKGQDVLIKGISLLHHKYPDLVVKFIGAGPMKTKYQKLADELGVQDHCHFLGELPHDEVLKHLARSTISVVPSRSDNFPTTVIESLSVGTPVIASNTGGIPDIFQHNKEGLLVPPGDPQALAHSIDIMLSHEELRRKMGEHARQRFLNAFESSKVIPKQADYLEHLVL